MTTAERTRRHRLKHGNPKRAGEDAVSNCPSRDSPPELDAARSRIRDLEAELAAAKARIGEMTHEAIAQAQAFRDEWKRRAAKPKAEKAPLPPDEERDRQIKGLKTANQNLRAKVNYLTQHYDEAIAFAGGMSFATQSAIAKCLHPDHNPSEAQRAEACRLFTSWKADKDKARRGAR